MDPGLSIAHQFANRTQIEGLLSEHRVSLETEICDLQSQTNSVEFRTIRRSSLAVTNWTLLCQMGLDQLQAF